MLRPYRDRLLIQTPDGGPGVYANRGRKFLQTEPRAGLIRAHLKSHALAENIDGQLEILQRRRAERERLLRLRRARGIGEAGQRQVPCPFDEHGEIAEQFSVSAEIQRLLDGSLRKIVRSVIAG